MFISPLGALDYNNLCIFISWGPWIIFFVYFSTGGPGLFALFIFFFILNFLKSRDRLVVRTLRCGRSNPGSNPGHGTFFSLRGSSREKTFILDDIK